MNNEEMICSDTNIIPVVGTCNVAASEEVNERHNGTWLSLKLR